MSTVSHINHIWISARVGEFSGHNLAVFGIDRPRSQVVGLFWRTNGAIVMQLSGLRVPGLYWEMWRSQRFTLWRRWRSSLYLAATSWSSRLAFLSTNAQLRSHCPIFTSNVAADDFLSDYRPSSSTFSICPLTGSGLRQHRWGVDRMTEVANGRFRSWFTQSLSGMMNVDELFELFDKGLMSVADKKCPVSSSG